MKKLLVIFAVLAFTVSCDTDDQTEINEIELQQIDKDEVPSGGDKGE